MSTSTARRDGPAPDRGSDPARWRSRPRLAVVLRSAILLAPVLASVGGGLVVARLLGDRPVWQFVLLVGSVCLATSVVVERVARRFLPLEALLRMTMLFPERAPSRLAVARLGRDRAEQRRLLASQPGADDVAHVMLALITALGRHDKRTRGHSERVRMITELLADQLALPQADRDRLRWAALLHDVGKLEVPVSVLSKPGPLDAAEWERMREHPTDGARLAGEFLAWLGEWAGGISHHHERWDGGGYPGGLAGEHISRAGRIVGVVDAFETMTAARSYKKAGGTRAALTELARCSGTQFDPAVVRQFLCIPVPRLWWATGPLGLLVQVPVIGSAQQSALQVSAAVTTSAGSTVAAAGTAAVVGVGSALGVPTTALPPAAATAVQDVLGDPAAPASDLVPGRAADSRPAGTGAGTGSATGAGDGRSRTGAADRSAPGAPGPAGVRSPQVPGPRSTTSSRPTGDPVPRATRTDRPAGSTGGPSGRPSSSTAAPDATTTPGDAGPPKETKPAKETKAPAEAGPPKDPAGPTAPAGRPTTPPAARPTAPPAAKPPAPPAAKPSAPPAAKPTPPAARPAPGPPAPPTTRAAAAPTRPAAAPVPATRAPSPRATTDGAAAATGPGATAPGATGHGAPPRP